MNPMLSRLLRSLLAAVFVSATVLMAQAGDPREVAIPNGSITLLNVTKATIDGHLNNGFRLTDIEYRSGAGIGTRFDAVLVQNTGAYQTSWWWLFDASATSVTNLMNANQARLIDLEIYTDSLGVRRFAGVLVDNTGVNGKAWWWLYDTDPNYIALFVYNNDARIVDLDSYQLNGTTYYLAVMISNTGADEREWWWYTDRTTANINALSFHNNARVYDLEKHYGGDFDCVMVRDPQPTDGYWWIGLTSAEVASLQQDYGVRAIDIERYPYSLGSFRYMMATINNSNELTTDVGKWMRSVTDGRVGCWLQEVNGPNLAWLNGTTPFEPAQTITVLHHAHTMRRIHLGSSQPNSLATVFQDYSPSSPSCPIDSNPTLETLVTILDKMLRANDHRRTQAIVNYYGSSNLGITASTLLAMHDTELNHRIGCEQQAVAAPNRTSLRDLHRLHEAVANGWLGNERERFYELMPSSVGGLSLYGVILAEGTQLNLSQQDVDCFISQIRIADKNGVYSFASAPGSHTTEFAWISLPFVQSGVVAPREYTVGAFVSDASDPNEAFLASYNAIPRLLRPTIRAALMTWSPNVACTTSFGTPCGAPEHVQESSAPPRLGRTVDYAGVDGYPNAISVLAIGLSSTQANGVPLPLALGPIGGEPGCNAYNDAIVSDVRVSNGLGRSSFPFVVPSSPTVVGLEYFTQLWSFGPTSLKTSNSLRNVIGQ